MLAWLCSVSVSYGIAASASTNALQKLQRVGPSPSGGLAESKNDLQRAVLEVPKDPTARELLAAATAEGSNNPDLLSTAREHLVKAIDARPGSGYTWAALAAVKYRLGETDEQFEAALVN